MRSPAPAGAGELDSQREHYKLPRTGDDEAQHVPVVEAGVSVLNGAIMDRDSRVAVLVSEDTPVRRADSVDECSRQAGAVRTGEVAPGPLQIPGSMAPPSRSAQRKR